MAYYGNNIYNEKSYKVAVRRAKKQTNKAKNMTSSSATLKNENENGNENSNNEIMNNGFDQRNLINIPKAYKFFKQRKIEEYEESNKFYSKSELEKHIQRAWKNSSENPLNQMTIKENMNITFKCSLKKISNDKKKNYRKSHKNHNKINMDY